MDPFCVPGHTPPVDQRGLDMTTANAHVDVGGRDAAVTDVGSEYTSIATAAHEDTACSGFDGAVNPSPQTAVGSLALPPFTRHRRRVFSLGEPGTARNYLYPLLQFSSRAGTTFLHVALHPRQHEESR
jgi:hypothetical protein